ncbi:MAG: OB-fold nucleic acid binding domain-containing protein, partial [Patescibacteria group bacterium]
MRSWISEITDSEGKEIELYGWVHARRDHGKLVFIDLRDRTGLVQVVFGPKISEASELRLEYVVKIKGVVKRRPPEMINENIPKGKFEVSAEHLENINTAEDVVKLTFDNGL